MSALANLKVHPCGFGASPRLLQQLEQLSQALLQDRPVDAVQTLQECLETLLKYFAGCAAGLVKRLETTRPELEALAQHLENTLHYERLLRFSVSVLRGLEHPAQLNILEVFFDKANTNAPQPYLHTRWLQISAIGEGELLNLSAWCASTRSTPPTPEQAQEQAAAYLPILNSWLQQAAGLFGAFYPILSGPDPTSGRRRLIGLEKPPFSFDFLPAASWDARETTPIPLPLPLPSRPPETEGGTARRSESTTSATPRPGLRRPQARGAELLQDLERALQTAQSVSLSPQWWEQITQQVLRFVVEQPCGYLLLDGEPGCGRSMLFGGLDRNLREAHCPVNVIHLNLHGMDWDSQDLVEEIDERLLQLNPSLTIRPLGSRARRQLLEHSREQSQAVRLGLYLSQICHLSCELCLLLLEGLEFQSAILPTELPTGVFILVRNGDESGQVQSAQVRLRLNTSSPWYRDEVLRDLFESELSSHTQSLIDQASAGRICHLRLLVQSVKSRLCDASELPASEKLHEFLVSILERRHGERFHRLFWLLATARESVHLFELNLVGADSRLLIELLRDVPSLFQVSNLGVSLGSPAFRQFLEGLFNWRWTKLSRQFAEKATLELTESLEGQSTESAQVRSSLDRLCVQQEQLMSWLAEVRKPELRARVLTSEALARLFQEISRALEAEGRFTRQSAMLGRYLDALNGLPAEFQVPGVISTLAWGTYELALAYRRIGRLQESLSALEEARRSLEMLEEQPDRWCELWILRSEVLLALGDPRGAVEVAQQCWIHAPEGALAYRAGLRTVHGLVALGQTEQARLEMNKIRAQLHLVDAGPLKAELGEGMIALARRCLEEGDVGRCLDLCAEVREAYNDDLPQFSEVFLLEALSAALQGQAREALHGYALAIRKTTELSVSGSILGRIQLFRALSGRAKVFLSQERSRAAAKDVERAMKIGSRLARWQAGLAPEDRIRLARGFFESLRVRRLALDEATAEQLRELVDDAEETLRLLEASQRPGDSAANLVSMQGQIHALLASLAARLGDGAAQQEHLDRAIEALTAPADAPLLAEALQLRAVQASASKDWSLAIRSLCQAVQLLQNAPARASEPSLLEEQQRGPSLASCLELRARAYLQSGDLESALSDLDRLLETENRGSLYELRSSVQRQRGERQAALDDLERALERQPERGDLLNERCRLLVENGQPGVALQDYWRCPIEVQLEVGPALAAGLEQESATRLHHGLESAAVQSRAVEVWKHLVQHEVSSAVAPLVQALGNLGRSCLAEQRPDEARQHFQQALQLLGGGSDGLRAWLLAHLGRVEEQLRAPDAAMEAYTLSIRLYAERGADEDEGAQKAVRSWRYALARKRKTAGAVLEDLDWLIQHGAGAAWLGQRAAVLKELGQTQEAADSLRQALAGGLEPDLAWAVELAVLDSQNRHPEVLASLRQALSLLGEEPEAQLAQLEAVCLACQPWAAELISSLRGLADLLMRRLKDGTQEWRRLPDALVGIALQVQAADPELATQLLVLAGVLCQRQRPAGSLEAARLRKIRALRNLAVVARDSIPPPLPAELFHELGAAIGEAARWEPEGQPGELDRELTLMARAWQSLSPAWFRVAQVDRAWLLKIRRW